MRLKNNDPAKARLRRAMRRAAKALDRADATWWRIGAPCEDLPTWADPWNASGYEKARRDLERARRACVPSGRNAERMSQRQWRQVRCWNYAAWELANYKPQEYPTPPRGRWH